MRGDSRESFPQLSSTVIINSDRTIYTIYIYIYIHHMCNIHLTILIFLQLTMSFLFMIYLSSIEAQLIISPWKLRNINP